MTTLTPFEKVRYLGCTIVVRENDLEIRNPKGLLLHRARWQLSTARAFIRSYRKEK